MTIGLGWILSYSTINQSANAATQNEVLTWIVECIGTSSYECDRVTLYLLGECESKKPIPAAGNCEGSIQKYIAENGLQNERRLTQDEIVDDLRILDQQSPR